MAAAWAGCTKPGKLLAPRLRHLGRAHTSHGEVCSIGACRNDWVSRRWIPASPTAPGMPARPRRSLRKPGTRGDRRFRRFEGRASVTSRMNFSRARTGMSFRALPLDWNRFAAVDTSRTPKIPQSPRTEEFQSCTPTHAAAVRIVPPRFRWRTGRIQTPSFTGLRDRVGDTRLVRIVEPCSRPRTITS